MKMRSPLIVVLGFGLFACSEHPDEGTVVQPGPGVSGVPGGSTGITASYSVPISGGTLTIAKDGTTAVAADPDRDRVWLVHLDTESVTEVILQQGDEPGRSAVDGNGRVHVALRRGGAVVSIDLATGQLLARQPVCPAPRGIAYDATLDRVHVACETGELVTLFPEGGVERTLSLARDLRDVMVDGDRLLVTRFRSAELFVVDASGGASKSVLPQVEAERTPSIAWRSRLMPDGGVVMLYQTGRVAPVSVETGGYGAPVFDPCQSGSIVDERIGRVDPDRDPDLLEPGVGALPLPALAGPSDFAISPSGQEIAIVATGNSWGIQSQQKLLVVPTPPPENAPPVGCMPPTIPALIQGEPTAVAYDSQGRIVVQSREPAQLEIVGGPVIRLSDDSRADTGLALFHMNTGAGVACASCHAEGREDGRAWEFEGLGRRRTQTIAGGVISRAPFHWDGAFASFEDLVHDVMVSRMSGPRPNHAQIQHFAGWLDDIRAPDPKAIADVAAVDRGRELFFDEGVACGSCHSGAALTNGKSADVGTNGMFQIPSLVGIGARAPFMHDGCAPTLRDRFGSCGGSKHGNAGNLTEPQLDDLIAFLESL
jgi:mono/diheme cytochrome c family protein